VKSVVIFLPQITQIKPIYKDYSLSAHVNINESVKALRNHVEAEDFSGWDPYDGLTSPLFRLPFLRRQRAIRFLAQQAVKRCPINPRPFLGIPKTVNPVTLGLCIQGYAYLAGAFPEDKGAYEREIPNLIDRLKRLSPFFNPEINIPEPRTKNSELRTREAFRGACWGYPFPWEARFARIPAYGPTVVATGIIVNGLYEAWRLQGIEACRDLVVSAADFVMHDLNRTYDGDSFCFSYSPFDQQQVLNASMKGVRILVQAAAVVSSGTKRSPLLVDQQRSEAESVFGGSPVTCHSSPVTFSNDDHYTKLAEDAVNFAIQHQHEDGSFPYSLAGGGGWSDSYHTGYVLDCLDEYMKLTGDYSKKTELTRGFGFFKENFIAEGKRPKIYADREYPVDCTAAAQVILTLCRFGEYELADRVASWTITNMQAPEGYFIFKRPNANRRRRTDFIRWSDAWMFAALAYLLMGE
jgi:hypothetical protein